MGKERRRTIILGASFTEWGLILSFITGGITIYMTLVETAGAADKRSQKNEASIEKLQSYMKGEIGKSEARIKYDMDQKIDVVREDIRELRHILLKDNGH